MLDKTIDPARTGLSKSLMTTPCARKAWYGETVRDAGGRRLSFPMSGRVVFGRAVDRIVGAVAMALRSGQEPDWDGLIATSIGIAVEEGSSEPIETELLDIKLHNAMHLYRIQPDGLARLLPHITHLRIQGDDGRSLRAGDIIGTPDFLCPCGVIDVKTSSRRYEDAKFWRTAEMGVYALLFAEESGGELPGFLAYQVYVRKAKPEWQWLETPGTAALVGLGRLHAAHWRAALAAGDPDLFDFDTTYCGDCPFRAPLPEYGHDGCPVGALVPVEEAA